MFSTLFAIICIALIGIILLIVLKTMFSNQNKANIGKGSLMHLSENMSIDKETLAGIRANKPAFEHYTRAIKLYRNQNYKESAAILQSLIDEGVQSEVLYRRTIETYIQEKNYTSAGKLLTAFTEKYTLNDTDYLNSALIKHFLVDSEGSLLDNQQALALNLNHILILNSRGNNYILTEHFEQAIIDFTKIIELNPESAFAYNNRGYTYNFIGNYEKAIIDFDKAMELKPKFAYAFNNRGYAKIKLGLLEEGLIDTNKSIELDGKNGYAYRNLGIYHLQKNELNKALQLLLKGKEMDKTMPLIDDLIDETNKKIEAQNSSDN
jgi:tetratricopeptide (TPR) repeat protein